MFDLCEELNVNKFYISHLVYSGRGKDNLEIDISKEQRKEYVDFIINKAFEYYKTKRYRLSNWEYGDGCNYAFK